MTWKSFIRKYGRSKLSRELNITPQCITYWLNGKSKPKIDILYQLHAKARMSLKDIEWEEYFDSIVKDFTRLTI
jgi:hypothetical protein